MKLVAVTPEVDVENEHKFIAMLIAEGFIVHCRKPGKSAVEMAAYLRAINPDFRSSLAIHAYHEVAADMGIKRLHFPEELRLKTTFESDKYQGFTLSTSIHDPQELDESHFNQFSYVFCGPVFDSISKDDYPGNPEWRHELNESYGPDKVAIGGMTPEKLLELSRWGYDGIAFSGYLWKEADAMERKIDKIKEIWLKDLLL